MCKSDDGGSWVVEDGMVLTDVHVKQGDLSGSWDGVHVLKIRAEEPTRQESERP